MIKEEVLYMNISKKLFIVNAITYIVFIMYLVFNSSWTAIVIAIMINSLFNVAWTFFMNNKKNK